MNINLKSIDYRTDHYEIKEALARILHSDEFTPAETRKLNFQVKLNESDHVGIRNNGSGMLTVPDPRIGNRLLQLTRRKELEIKLYGRRIFLDRAPQRPDRGTVETLQKVPFQDPAIDRQRDEKLLQLDRSLRIDQLQFGVWLRRPLPNQRERGLFAIEWEKSYTSIGNAWIRLEYDHKLMRIQLGDPSLDDLAHSVVIKFSNIRQLWTGYEFGNAFVCFDLNTPAILECEWFNRALTGIIQEDSRKFRQRIGAVDNAHEVIAPYAHQIRITLYRHEDLAVFVELCGISGLRAPWRAEIDADKHGFFTSKKIGHIQRRLEKLPWTVAFQVEALLHNGLLNTEEVLLLWEPISDLSRDHPALSGEILRYFGHSLRSAPPVTTLLKTLQGVCSRMLDNGPRAMALPGGLMYCHHVTFTPTRMTLEGPYAVQSNRAIRQYVGFSDNFLRVDFRDEDRLQYRWDREVDGTTFLQHRVGGILKEGFDLAGRHFEFLAYSSSALRDHAVWFVSPFQHPTVPHRIVNAAEIRRQLGDFSGVLTCPAKFAARLAQAFTATDPSVKITRDQWKVVRDLGKAQYLFTDGVGTISRQLGGMIWSALCIDRPDYEKRVVPSAYQIRFLGYKGVVCIDDHLEGIMMCLRPSMDKFKVIEETEADIEIARAFYSPGDMYLNRPLIMLLEDRKVKAKAFLELQEKAIANARMAENTIKHFTSLLKGHQLGGAFGLSYILQNLASQGLELKHPNSEKTLSNHFITSLVTCAVSSVLRDIKYRGRIPVPGSWSLVGVADEGPTYIEQGDKEEDVFMLMEGEIFACIQTSPDEKPIYLERTCVISRSPTIHPGDVQRVWAVGKPPDDKKCFFRNLKNCVVFPSRGKRSMCSCLAGGDLDGDLYDICLDSSLLATMHAEPAEYPPVPKREISLDELVDPASGKIEQELIIEHVCDFVVEYINSDVLGLLSDNHLIRADQSSDGVFDKGCLMLAKLCSQAVDYPKNGVPVDIRAAPRRLIPYKPDWKEGEVENPLRTDFYESEKALGQLYRALSNITTQPLAADRSAGRPSALDQHPVYKALDPVINSKLKGKRSTPQNATDKILPLFRRYVDELRYICTTHTLTDQQDVRLSEEEIVIGTILAQCSQHRWRQERTYRMRLHATNLVKELRADFLPTKKIVLSSADIRKALELAWSAWRFTVEKIASPEVKNYFGLNSFGLVALHVVFECFELLASE